MLMLLMPEAAAKAETLRLAGSMNPLRQAVIPFYDAPSAGAEISWWCYPETTGTVLDRGSGFVKLRIGNLTGWVPAYSALAAGDTAAEGITGEVVCHGKQRYRALLSEPKEDAKAVASLGGQYPVQVLNVSSDGAWLQVRVNGSAEGFLPACAVRWGQGRITAASAEERIHLRRTPDKKGDSLGSYYCGVPVDLIFSVPGEEGWTFVSILDVAGWIHSEFVLPESRVGAYLPPVATVSTANGQPLNLRSGPGYTTAVQQEVPAEEKVEVLGAHGRWAHVRLREGNSGYMHLDYLNGELLTAVRAEAEVRADTLLDTMDGEAEIEIPAGALVTMTEDRPWSAWYWTETEWTFGESEEVNVGFDGVFGLVPVEDLDFGW